MSILKEMVGPVKCVVSQTAEVQPRGFREAVLSGDPPPTIEVVTHEVVSTLRKALKCLPDGKTLTETFVLTIAGHPLHSVVYRRECD